MQPIALDLPALWPEARRALDTLSCAVPARAP